MSKADIIAKDLLNSINIELKSNIADEPMEVGKVTSVDPLIVEVGGLPLYETNLYINKYLLAWDEEVNIVTSIDNEHSHTINEIHHLSKLNINDYVCLYGVEWNSMGKTYQKYHLINVIK